MANIIGTLSQPGDTLAITGGVSGGSNLDWNGRSGLSGGSGTSAASVARSSRYFTDMDSMSSILDRISGVSAENTAKSEQMAADLRNWQEKQNQLAMQFNSAEAAKNRDWQKMMSDTAHQREVKDLLAAGLNPVLSASGGNGAAVGSGATASGVTSSGAMGDVDKSFNQSLVGLLGTMWTAQTQLEAQRLTAENNMAIAERNNSSAQLIAEMYVQQSREASILAAQTGLSQSQISAAASRYMASVSAQANITSSEMYAEASRYSSDLGLRGTQYRNMTEFLVNTANSIRSYNASIYGANTSASTARDVARLQSDTSKRGQDLSFGSSVFNSLTNLGSSALRGLSGLAAFGG